MQSFWKWIQDVQKIVLLVFFPENIIIFLGFWTNFSCSLSLTKLTLISRFQNTCAKEHLGNLFQMQRFLNHVPRAGNFQTMIEKSATKVRVFQFLCAEDFLVTFFPRNLWLFWTVSLNIHGLAEMFSTVLSKVQSRRGRQRPGFFLIPQLFCVELEPFYVNFWAKKLQFFSQNS